MFYFDNGKNLYQTSKKFSLNTKNILRWILVEEQIRDSSKGRRRVEFQRTALHPEMEKKLYSGYREQWQERAEGEGMVVSCLCKTNSFGDATQCSAIWQLRQMVHALQG